MAVEQLELFEMKLPHRPYCTDDKENGLIIRDKKEAIKKKLIQPNTVSHINWLVFDYDKTDILGRIEAANLPYPNLLAINPKNGNSHVFYSLVTGVCRTDNAKWKPLDYLAKIQYALGQKLGADVGYSGLLSKNPLNDHWRVIQLNNKSYELGELAEYLELPLRIPKRACTVGLGRNCTVFEIVRKIAYSNVLKFKIEGCYSSWYDFIYNECEKINNEFPESLFYKEIETIAKSISKWTWRKFSKQWTDGRFSEIQARRGKNGGKRSGEVRAAKSSERRSEAQKLRQEGRTLKEISTLLEVPLSTVGRWCK